MRTTFARLAAKLALVALAFSAGVATSVAQEVVTFPSLDGSLTLKAHLSRPAGDQPRPAVVLMHGCSGLLNPSGQILASYRAWTRALLAKGYVVLAVDGAGSRSFGQTCVGAENRLTMLRDRPKDAFAALAYLQAQPFVDGDRIALMGWSQGGGAVLLTINEKSIGRPPSLTRDFKAAIAFYPGSCSDRRQSKPFTAVERQSWTTKTPLLLLFGEADTWTPFAPCEAFIAAAKARGNPVELKSYPGAHHSFDAPNLDRTELPHYRLANGRMPVVGTDDAARADAMLRSLAFIERHLQ